MPKYKILNCPVLHGAKGEKTATRYEIGDTIELTETEALALAGNVEPLQIEKKKEEKDDKVPPEDNKTKVKASADGDEKRQ